MQRLLEVMRQLRAPDGCPWDRKQTHDSLREYLLEEAAEAVDAIAAGRRDRMADELGDVLLQVAFHAVIGEEEGTFGYDDIENAIVEKLIRRHPHIFADTSVSDADEVVTNWQAIKALERRERGESEDEGAPELRVPRSLPALMRAAKVGKAAGWEAPEALEPARTLEGKTASPEEVGNHLLAVAQFARVNGIDPELALREAVDRALEEAPEG